MLSAMPLTNAAKQGLLSGIGERHGGNNGAAREAYVVALRACLVAQVLAGDAILFHEVIGQQGIFLEHHGVAKLRQVGLLVGLAVQIDGTVFNLQHLSGHAHAALHVVFAAVGGAGAYASIGILMVAQVGLAYLVYFAVALQSL